MMAHHTKSRPATWRYLLALFLLDRAINLLKRAPEHQQHDGYKAALAKLVNASLAVDAAWRRDYHAAGDQ